MMIHLLPPELTERYEPIDILGYGAFAMVVKARDKNSGEIVAIKHLQTKQGDRQKFFRELNLSTRLRHPNVVRCMDVYASNDQSSDMVFEFADKGMLRTYLPEGEPFDFAQSLVVISHIALGLDYAHSQGVVHRDLKPENILIFTQHDKGELIYKIADFGVAKLLGPAQKTATSIGSPSYMAPEQFYDSYDLSSDVYALGIIFYELLHGVVPFNGSAAEIFKGHLEGGIDFRDNLDPETRKLVTEMLLKTPGARPKAKDVFKRVQKIAATFDVVVDEPETMIESSLPINPEEITSGSSIFSDFDGSTDKELPKKAEEKIPEPEIAEPKIAAPVSTVQETNDLATQSSEETIEEDEAIEFFGASSSSDQPTLVEDDEETFSLFDEFPGIEKPVEQPKIAVQKVTQKPVEKVPPPVMEEEEELFAGFDDSTINRDSTTQRLPVYVPEVQESYIQHDANFFEGFEDEDQFEGKVVGDLSSVQRIIKANYGRFIIEKKWSRAIDRKTVGLLNLEDQGDLLMVIPGKGLQEIMPGGMKGKLIYEGEYEILGQPILGHVCMVREQTFCVMQRGEFYQSDWTFDDKTLNIAISHDLSTVASFSGSTVTCRRWGGKLLWTGQFDRTGKGIFLAFTSDGSLMICSYMGEDQAVHFFDNEGESLARFWMDSKIVSAVPHHDRIGLWVITAGENDEDVCTLFNVTQHHKRPVCALEKPLYNLKASRDWLAGFDEHNQLHLIDLSVGVMMPVKEVAGTPLDISVGKTLRELYILTTENQVMRYVTALEIGFIDTDSRAVTKLDRTPKPKTASSTNLTPQSDQEPEALFAS